MAKDLEQRFDSAMKKGEKQDRAQTFKDKANKMHEESAQRKAINDKISGMSDEIRSNLKKYGTPHAPQKRTTSDGYMPRKGTVKPATHSKAYDKAERKSFKADLKVEHPDKTDLDFRGMRNE